MLMKHWHYHHAGERKGPVEESILIGLLKSGELQSDTLVWSEGMEVWVEVSKSTDQAFSTFRPPPRRAGVLGIDFGTCNCCMAVVDNGKTVIIPNAEGARTTASIVALAADGRWLVGAPAKRQAVTNPRNTIFSVKRLMGRKYSETCATAKWLSYDIVKAPNDDTHVKIGARAYAPQELAAIILCKLKIDAEMFLGVAVTQAVITVPSAYTDSQRQAIKEAAKIAGLDALRIVNESTAACLAYGLDKKTTETVAIVHFGGGTFDVTILNIGDGVFEVMATSGDTHLGGDDIDNNVIDWLLDIAKTSSGVELTGCPTARQRLKETAESAKCNLTETHEVNISIPFIGMTNTGPAHLTAILTRETLENLAAPIFERMTETVQNCLKDSGVTGVDHVVLAGAMTRMPGVQRKIEELFGRPPFKGVHPDEAVAIGAALQGGIMMGSIKDALLLDVTRVSLGFEEKGGLLTTVVARNTTIPTKQSTIISTTNDNQASIDVRVFQGEHKRAADNKFVGGFRLDGIPPAPRGVPQIKVTFDIDANEILRVSAKDLGTGKEQGITNITHSGLTDTELAIAKDRIRAFSASYCNAHASRHSALRATGTKHL